MSAASQSVGFIQLADRPASGRYLRTAGGETFLRCLNFSSGTSPAQETLTLANFCKRTLNVQGTWSLPTSRKNDQFGNSLSRYGDPGVPGTGQCVDYDRATACKTFNQPTTPCLYSCPRCWLNLGVQLIFFTMLLQLKLIGWMESVLNFEV